MRWVFVFSLIGFLSSQGFAQEQLDIPAPKVTSIIPQNYTYSGYFLINKITQSRSDGSGEWDSLYSWGAQGGLGLGSYGVNLGYQFFKTPTDGNNAVRVEQKNHWALLDGVYRFNLSGTFIPYISLGVGTLYKGVNTEILGTSEDQGSWLWSRSVGGGLQVKGDTGVSWNMGLRFYQYAAEGGFMFTLGLGFDTLTPQSL